MNLIYQRTWGREVELGANSVPPTPLLNLEKWKAVTWAGVTSLQMQLSFKWALSQRGVCKPTLYLRVSYVLCPAFIGNKDGNLILYLLTMLSYFSVGSESGQRG